MFALLITLLVADVEAASRVFPPVVAPAPLSDGQILDAVITLDRTEIAMARLVLSRTRDPAIRELADGLVDRHSANLVAAQRLGNTAPMTLAPSAVGAALDVEGSAALASLERQPDAALDQAWLRGAADRHRAALERLASWAHAEDKDVVAFVAATRIDVAAMILDLDRLRDEPDGDPVAIGE